MAASKKSAVKKSPSRSSQNKARATDAPVLDRIVDAGLDELTVVGWRDLTMDAIAARAGVGLGEALLAAPSKRHLALAFLDRIDAKTLMPVKKIDPADSTRDRLFEILMRRFDALNKQRDATKALMHGVARDPAAAFALTCRLDRSYTAILAAAGVSTDGFVGFARIQGLKAVVAYGLRAWMSDDSADLAKTMAALDRALTRAERLAGFMTLRRRAEASEEAT
jgi:ubiquinone biosynthesis protein COQ9